MELPKFLLGDNTDYPNAIFIIHTDFPRFIINLENDEVEWLEDFDSQDQKELEISKRPMIFMIEKLVDTTTNDRTANTI